MISKQLLNTKALREQLQNASKTLSKIESGIISAIESEEKAQKKIQTIQEILNHCRLRNELPTIESIECAIDGKSFAGCLASM